MKKESINELCNLLIKHYKKIGNNYAFTYGDIAYTGDEIVVELQKESPLGIRMIDNIILLSIDLLSRGKKSFNDNKTLKNEI